MYFTFEEMSLQHLQPPMSERFDSDDYHQPCIVFADNLCSKPTSVFLSSYPDQRPDDFFSIQTGIHLIDDFDGAINNADAWQAFFDDIDFTFIQDQSILEFMLSMRELTGNEVPLPVFEISGPLAHRLMNEFKKIRDVNTRIDYLPPEPLGPCLGHDDLFYHAYALIEEGFLPSYYDGHTLKFERAEDILKRERKNQSAFLRPDGDGHGWDGYNY